MENASQVGEEQGRRGAGNFVVYAVFNCPFCYSLTDRLHAMVLGERFGWKQIESAGRGLVDNGAEDRHVVTEGLARGGRGDDDHVPAFEGMGDRFSLVRLG